MDKTNVCEHCGKQITVAYGSGRFCSRSCANSRNHSAETKAKISHTLIKEKINFDLYVESAKQDYMDGVIAYKNLKYYTKEAQEGKDYVVCPYCKSRMAYIQFNHLRKHGKNSDDLYNDFGKEYQIMSENSHLQKSVSSKETQSHLIETGKHKGWQSRNIRSYAEIFWEQVLINNNISFQSEYAIKKRTLGIDSDYNYFLDFLIDGFIDLEIDGKQHTYDERKTYDIERDNVLSANGYIVYRIEWINPNSDTRKEKVRLQTERFLEWYTSIKVSKNIEDEV